MIETPLLEIKEKEIYKSRIIQNRNNEKNDKTVHY